MREKEEEGGGGKGRGKEDEGPWHEADEDSVPYPFSMLKMGR